MQDHHFVLTTFTKPTYCNHCSNFIFGIVNQGYTCQDCKLEIHAKCLSKVTQECKKQEFDQPHPGIAKRNSLPQQLPPSPTKEQVDLETILSQPKIENLKNDILPQLSLGVFMHQNNRFTARQGPLIALNSTISKIFNWESIPNTLCFLLMYILLCLYPRLILIMPQLVIAGVSLYFYSKKSQDLRNGKPGPEPHIMGSPPKLNPTLSETKDNLQHIQNTMIQLSDLYDILYNFYKMIDWSDPNLSITILKYSILSATLTILLTFIISINILFLIVGVLVFFLNTNLAKDLMNSYWPAFVNTVNRQASQLEDLIKEGKLNDKDPVIEISVFENQRWWLGQGWNSNMFPGERSPWSDESGIRALPPIKNYRLPLPTDFDEKDRMILKKFRFEWHDDEWNVDYQWTDVDDRGWVYSGNGWETSKKEKGPLSFTRRRRWTRKAVLKPSTSITSGISGVQGMVEDKKNI